MQLPHADGHIVDITVRRSGGEDDSSGVSDLLIRGARREQASDVVFAFASASGVWTDLHSVWAANFAPEVVETLAGQIVEILVCWALDR